MNALNLLLPQLLANASELLALTIVYLFIIYRLPRHQLWVQLVSGILFGGVAVIGMSTPFTLIPGVFFDGRSMVLSLAALFGGPVVASISALIASLFRLYVGGTGMVVGLGTIITASIIGVMGWWLRSTRRWTPNMRSLLAFGFLVHIVSALWFLLLPPELRWTVVRGVIVPYLVVFPVATILVGAVMLVAERRIRSDRRIVRSERMLRSFIANAPVSLAMLDRDLNFLAVSRHWVMDYRLEDEKSLQGRSLYEVFPETPQRYREAHQGALKGETSQSAKDKVEFPDGREVWVRWEVKPWFTEEDEIGGIIIFTEDVTGMHQAEQDLQQSESRLRALLATVPDMVWLKDPTGKFLICNPRTAKTLGVAPDDVIGKTAYDFYDRDTARIYQERDRKAIESGVPVISEEHSVPAGTKEGRIHETKRVPVHDATGKLIGVLGIARDISRRKATEVELKKLAQAIEQSPESIVITGLDAEIEYVNQAFERTTGYTLEEVRGKNPSILQSGNTPREVFKDMWDTLMAGRTWRGELHNCRKDGTEFIEAAIISPVRDSQGRPRHYVAIKADITEQKKMEVELARHRSRLEELVDERTEQLTEATRQAELANRAKSSFLAVMSHEIRTPLNAIIGLSHINGGGEAESLEKKRLEKIHLAGHHLLSIINDILDISKIESGKFELEHTDFSIRSVLDHVHSLIKDQAEEKNLAVRVDFDLEGAPEWFRGDPTRLRQALLNYAGNAVKFTESGSARLGVRVLESFPRSTLMRFEVEDSGIGIEKEKLAVLFDSFQQSDTSMARKYGGTGLGLAITRRLAEKMGGQVGCESEAGEGSTFWFTVLLDHGQRPETSGRSGLDDCSPRELLESLGGARVLLAEDNDINREVATELLRGAGLEVETVTNGREAVEAVKSQTYDLVLMDIQMPEMDGLEATRLIRDDDALSELPILAMTANVFEENRHACREAGMNDFVAKPVDPDALFTTVARWLRREGTAGD